jgi:hypothetical protein
MNYDMWVFLKDEEARSLQVERGEGYVTVPLI